MNMKYKIFISYSSKDLEKITPFLDLIKKIKDLDYYFYPETKTPGEDKKEDILMNIRSSNALLLFHSRNSENSVFVQHEVGSAVGLTKKVIIALLDKSKPQGMIDGVNYLDFTDKEKFDQEIKKLTQCINDEILKHQAKELVKVTDSSQVGDVDWRVLLAVIAIIIIFFYIISKSETK